MPVAIGRVLAQGAIFFAPDLPPRGRSIGNEVLAHVIRASQADVEHGVLDSKCPRDLYSRADDLSNRAFATSQMRHVTIDRDGRVGAAGARRSSPAGRAPMRRDRRRAR